MMQIQIIICSLVGFFISLYAYYVESNIKKDASYKPACDINDRISCTKPLTSEYSNIFFVSNTLAGMAYYVFIACAAWLQLQAIVLATATLGCMMTFYLAYLLYFKVKSFCLVCSSLYLINILLFVFAVY